VEEQVEESFSVINAEKLMSPSISALYSFTEAASWMFCPGEETNILDTFKTFDCNHSKYL